MGKLFNAFTKTQAEIADPALKLPGSPADHSAPAFPDPSPGKVLLPSTSKPLTSAETVVSRTPSSEADVQTSEFFATEEGPQSSSLMSSRSRMLPIRVVSGDPLLPFDSEPSRASEQYRYLRTKLLQHPRQPRCILVSSPGPGDGKTVSAINLTGVLSLKSGADVVLVDGDLRRSSVHKHLGISRSPGLVDLLRGSSDLQNTLIQAEQFPHLFVLPAGKSDDNPAELFESANWGTLVKKLREAFKYVVIDSPPVGSVADYDLLQATCDGIVLVLRPDHTKRTMAQKAIDTVAKDKLLGAVLNCSEDWFLLKNTQYGAYSYFDGYGNGKLT